ncbi:cell wall-binding repeat-containing protein [Peptostreptococcus anaerobius]|uniref:cell wall-binding repeat-containing protein n=1 Tax=Peptostreptococcus TaxID=1257 RepID=UPI00232CC06B|nr:MULTISPECIES: cell wall-binding repeat-containing protein [Peptostreptococcus]MDB8821315.1 cell wall-binding repeat-containing protein [Peptostreptococcus anaerobius]MDB8826939.1 cell wall-binding repeat-containing protein [Peptostreptococcus anaerobius]MDB8827707.1 cell wall-binding repeat-containing protein [Peptostreptococcus anaerobius]MDB8829525.1 cell wall-binding repeat-containing protein [Peptostreptococcus anaerobius]MDB8831480.1 cell wall-binding repeat-containing protein [Peptost
MVYNRNKKLRKDNKFKKAVLCFLTGIMLAGPIGHSGVRAYDGPETSSLNDVDIIYGSDDNGGDNVNGESVNIPKPVKTQDGHTMDITTFDFRGTRLRSFVKQSGIGTYTSASSKYDPRSLGYMTPVRDQQSLGICWTFAGNATLESYLKKSGLGDYDLSEEHMRWWGKGGLYNWNIGDTEGSTNETSVGYFTSWMGPKLEADIPYNGRMTTEQGAKKPYNYDSAKMLDYRVTDVVNVATDEVSVKNAILKYGAVMSGYYDDKRYMSLDKNAFYCDDKKGQTHAITIVGWDNDYPRDKFTGLARPNSNGAWLVKNSWGNYNSEGGYMWISYEDKNILSYSDNYAISNVKKDQGQKIYQHEYSMSSNLRDDKALTVANAFNFEAGEVLQGVMFATDSQGANYEIYYIPYVSNSYDYSKKLLLKSGRVDHSGYTTVDINNHRLNGKGAIGIRIDNTQAGQKSTINIEKDVVGYKMYKSSSNPGESFVLINDSLVDMKKIGGLESTNPVIKAITSKNKVSGENIIAGSNRYKTAVEISKKGWTNSENVVLVNSKSMPDALTATSLASLKSAPILITDKDKLNPDIENEINRLAAKNIIVVGGDSSVSMKISEYLSKRGMKVERIAGRNRYETSENIAKEVARLSKSKDTSVNSVALVNGRRGLADAISFSPISGEKNIPIILVGNNMKANIPTEIGQIEKTYIIGGSGSLSEGLEKSSKNPLRLSGNNRNNTNASIIDYFYKNRNSEFAFVAKDGIPREDSLIDGLAVGAYAAKTKSPIVLAHSKLKKQQRDAISAMKIGKVYQVGIGNNEVASLELINMILDTK